MLQDSKHYCSSTNQREGSILYKEINDYLVSYLGSSFCFEKKSILIERSWYKYFSTEIIINDSTFPLSQNRFTFYKKNSSFNKEVFDVVIFSSFFKSWDTSVENNIKLLKESVVVNGTFLASNCSLSRIGNFKPDLHKFNKIFCVGLMDFQKAGNVLMKINSKNVVTHVETMSVQYDCPYLLFSDLIFSEGIDRKKLNKIKRFARLKKSKMYKSNFDVTYSCAN